MSLKYRVEATLFLTDKPLPAQAIAQLVNADVQLVRQIILELIHEYEERDSALEIADDSGYIMQVKDEFSTVANDMAPIDLPVSVVRTLSAIAIKQPVMQSEIVRIRGAGAYEHIKELLEKDLIIKKEEGRSPTLSTTKKFQEYFRLSHDARDLRDVLKVQLESAMPIDMSPNAPSLPDEGSQVAEHVVEQPIEQSAEESPEQITEPEQMLEPVAETVSESEETETEESNINQTPNHHQLNDPSPETGSIGQNTANKFVASNF